MAKICVLTSAHSPFDTRIYHKEARTLAAEDYQVHVIAHHPSDDEVDGVRIHALDAASSHKDRFVDLPRMYRIARSIEADAYHFHDPGLLPVGATLALRTDAAVVYDCHEQYQISFQDYDFPPDVLNPLVSRTYPVVQSALCRPMDAIVAATEWIQADFERAGHEPVQLVRNFPITEGIEIDTSGIDRSHDVVLVYVGGLTPTRGVHVMVEALRRVRERDVDAGLWLLGTFGNDATETAVEDAVATHGLGDHVRFFGRVEHEHVFSYLAAADLGLALLDPGPYDYGIPTKVFEYMYVETPVVASDTEANRRYLSEDVGRIVPYEDPARIADEITELARDDEQRRQMGRAARRLVEEEYSWEVERERLLGLYETLLG